MRIAVLGLGEAGTIYATDLAAHGAHVAAADPRAAAAPPGVVLAPGTAEAVTGAALVLSLVGARAASAALAEALPAMARSAVFADLNTAAPEEKRRLAQQAAGAGVRFADVAVLAPVPRARIATPLLVSGPGEAALTAQLAELGIPATSAGPEPGAAAGLKLLRSVFMKGLAATILEAVTAASAVGAAGWVTDQIAAELGPDGPALVQRLLEGTRRHAVRREEEMLEVRSYLDALGSAHPMTDATIEWLRTVSAAAPPSGIQNR
jgi:3-hydroxyisobutyrate dehydrogenase-like beta-hydroxyacid dehydrogenase